MSNISVDYLIVGQGLAGTVFALQALERGRTVLVVDREDAITSSKIAAGLVNPLSGPRLALSWRVNDLWPAARGFYRKMETSFGEKFFEEKPILRLLENADQRQRWEKRRTDANYAPYWRELPGELDREKFYWDFGGLETVRSGRLDLPCFLSSIRKRLTARDAYISSTLDPADLEIQKNRIHWLGRTARRIVFCQGFEGNRNPLFDWVPLRPCKGEILSVTIPGLHEDRIIHRGKWLVPLGNRQFWAGATNEFHRIDFQPTPEGRAEVETGLRQMLRLPIKVTGQRAAIRPMGHHGRPRLGRHPDLAPVAFFNGLGSKGTLLAPYFANQLLEHLESKAPLDAEVDLTRYYSK